ncbi:MAG: DUF2589 domain-containing protein [Deltaproteobacteria bacterium]
MDPNFIGSVVNAVPIDKMVAAPLMASVQAQIAASKAFADFLLTVCIKDGKANQVQFDYEETVVDPEGNIKGAEKKTIRAPLLAVLPLPNMAIDSVEIAFDLAIHQAEQDTSSTAAEGGFEAKLGWGPFSVSAHGSVTHKQDQTRSTDTTAKYSFNVKGSRQPPPEALMKIIDTITAAQARPGVLPKNSTKEALVKPDDMKTTIEAPKLPAADVNKR